MTILRMLRPSHMGEPAGTRGQGSRRQPMRTVNSADRRSDYDVTNRIQVSDPASVSAAVQAVYSDLYPRASLKPLHTAFADFTRFYRGEDPRFHGCETTYHDM